MKIFSKLILITFLELLATSAFADTLACKGCEDQKSTATSPRDQIKADRAKYDQENGLVTARPWDGNRPETGKPQKIK